MKRLFLASVLLICMAANPVLAEDKTSSTDEPIILINTFIVPEGKVAESIAFWEKAADFMRTQPGYISTTLHQTILPDAKFELINVAKWRSVGDFKNASHAMKTQSGIKPIDGLIPNPSLYKVIISD
ncbi:MAG TPA: antibiotic biosynthesis monooxygenase [Candidatus Megaira endosymbiont of Nemacystus decipiens]|nr:antibiotic biosynthesis monooxygenase [Candidatus Megaera endosymbiont of Nemacystus decipiens]